MKKVTLITLLAFLSLSFAGFSQNQAYADSLKRLLDTKSFDADKELEILYWLANSSDSPDEVLKYGERLLKRAISLNDKTYELKAYYCLGIGHRLMGNLAEALEYQFKAADEANRNAEFTPFLTEVYSEISTCYTQNGDSENALLYGSKAIGILRKIGDKQELALSLLNLGYDYYLIGNYDSAMAYYNESEPIMEQLNLPIGEAYILGNRALIYWKRGEKDRAKKDLFAAIKMLKPIGDSFGTADYYNQIGNIFLSEEEYDKVIEYASKSFEISVEEEFKEQARDASNLLFKSHSAMGNYKKALAFQTQYYLYKDDIQNLETTQRIADLRTEFEVGRKQAEVDLLIQQKRNQQIITIAVVIILLIAIALIFIINSYLKTKNRLNRQLERQRNSLLLLNETKDKFFSIISHDLRGPVNTLNGLITVSKIYLEEGKSDRVGTMVDKMEHSMKGLMRLLDNLLTWALQQRGHFPYLPEILSIRSIVENIIDTYEDTALEKGIKLEWKNDSGDFNLYADRNTTSAIVRNLLNNALKYTGEGGEVTLTTSINETTRHALIKVADTGVGMSTDKVEKLFRLDEKKSSLGTSGETGLGLGLQLVSEFTALNKGRIEVESEEGKGTTFIVYLPLA